MNLYEYQAKQLFICYGLPIPTGYTCTTPNEAEEAASKIGKGPWVVKCQVRTGGRGKAGGVKVVTTKREIRNFAEKWLGKYLVTCQTDTKGCLVNKILVEAASDIAKELYLGAMIDRSIHRVVFMASSTGGVKIAENHAMYLIHKVSIDPLVGPMPYQGRELAFKLGLLGELINQFTNIFIVLANMFLERDLTLIEINPLVITSHKKFICLDGKISVDRNALFRQLDLYNTHDQFQENSCKVKVNQWNPNYIKLDGNIGCIVNGAGLAMTTMDLVKSYGGALANFLDIGGNSNKEHIIEAFKVILSEDKIKAILVNIFGGIVRCDLIADGIIDAVENIKISIPVIIRLEGNNSEIGIKKLAVSKLNFIITKSLTDATRQVVSLVKKQ